MHFNNPRNLLVCLFLFCYGFITAQSLYQDANALANLMKASKNKNTKSDWWFKLAESTPFIYSEFSLFIHEPDTVFLQEEKDYLMVNLQKNGLPGQLVISDKSVDSVLFSTIIKYDFFIVKTRENGSSDKLTITAPSGEEVISFEGDVIGNNIIIEPASAENFLIYPGVIGDFMPVYFNDLQKEINRDGTYAFQDLPEYFKLLLKEGGRTLAEITRDSVVFNPLNGNMYSISATDDSLFIPNHVLQVKTDQFRIGKAGEDLVIEFPGNLSYVFLKKANVSANLTLELIPDSTYLKLRYYGDANKKIPVTGFNKIIPLKQGACRVYDQVIIGHGTEVIKVVPLSKPRWLKKIAYNKETESIDFKIERDIHKSDINYWIYRKKYSTQIDSGFTLNLSSITRTLDYSCEYSSFILAEFSKVNFNFLFDVYELGKDGDTISHTVLSRSQLSEKPLNENILYKIVLHTAAAKEQIGGIDFADIYLKGSGFQWYPSIDPALEIFIKDGVANFFFTPAAVEEYYSVPMHKTDSLSILLGTHCQLKATDLNVPNLWGEISDKYRKNPFLGKALKDDLARNTFEQLPGMPNDSIARNIAGKLTDYYAWQKILFENKTLETEEQVSYDDLVNTYRTRIPSASDKLQVASEQFGSESQKFRRGLSTADIAAGLSDFIVDRAQEELNITFLDRLREDILHDSTEFRILFPQTAKMMSEFRFVQYRTLLDFAKTAFLQDLRNLGVNFPKLFSQLAKYEELRNDPKVYNIFLLYDIANKVYEDMPIDTVLLQIHSRLQERRTNLEESIVRKLGIALEKDTLSQAKLGNIIREYNEALYDFNVAGANLNYGYDMVRGELSLDIYNSGMYREFSNDEMAKKLALLQLSVKNDTLGSQYNLVLNNIQGDPDYAYQLNNLPFNRFQEFFAKPPETYETIGLGLTLSKSLFAPEITQNYAAQADEMGKGVESIQILRSELETEKANAAVSLMNYLPMLKKFKEMMVKKACLELALRSEIKYLPDSATHEIYSLYYLAGLIESNNYRENQPYDWRTIDHFYRLFKEIQMDSFIVTQPAAGSLSNMPVITGPSQKLNAYEELKILSVLSGDAEKINEEIDRATAFLERIAAVMIEQFGKINKSRLMGTPARDSQIYTYFLFSKELTNGALLLNYGDLMSNMDKVIVDITSGHVPKREMYETITDTLLADNYKFARKVQLIDPPVLTGNQFLDYYNQTVPFELGLKTTKILSKEMTDIRESVTDLLRISDDYRKLLKTLKYKYAGELMPALQQAEQFDSLTSITLLWLNAFKNGSTTIDSITVKDSTIIRVTKTVKGSQLTYDSIQVKYRKLASGPGVRRWITSQQFNQIMEDSLSRKAFLGLMYQRLISVDGSQHYSAPNMTLMATKMMNTIYEIDDAREMLRYKKRTSQPLGFQDYYPFIRTTIDMLNVVLETPMQSDGTSLSNQFVMLKDVPDISNESLSLFENIFAENYGNAIRNVVQLLSITWKPNEPYNPGIELTREDKKAQTQLKKDKEEQYRKNDKIRSGILVYGSFMANMVGAQTPDQVKAAITAVAVPPGNSSVKRNSRMNVDINSYLGIGLSVEQLKNSEVKGRKKESPAMGLSAPIGVTFSMGQWGKKEKQSFSLFTPILDIGAITTYRFNQSDVPSELPKLNLGNLISPGLYFLWNIPKSPFTIGAGAQFGPQLRKITVDGKDLNSSAWHYGVTASIDVPLFNLYTRQEKRR